MSIEWYYQVMGETVGPLKPAELREAAARGKIQADTPVRQGRDGAWIYAEKIYGLLRPRPG